LSLELKKTPLLTDPKKDGKYDFEYPVKDQLTGITDEVRLSKLRIWGKVGWDLYQIQVVLSNGMTSPVFSAKETGTVTEHTL